MAKIDVIIPVYNQANKLKLALNSLNKQTYQDFDIIIVNDGSTDNIQRMIIPYLKIKIGKSRPRLINQSNKGANFARNLGVTYSKSDYLIFFDADIVAKKTMLEKMHNALRENPNSAYAYSSFKFGCKNFKLWPFDPKKLRQQPYIHTTSLIKKRCFPGFDGNIKRLQDWDLWLTMLEKGYCGIFIPEILFKVKAGGTMSNWRPKSFYKFFKKNKKAIDYQNAVNIIKEKHNLYL